MGWGHILDVVWVVLSNGENIGRVTYLRKKEEKWRQARAPIYPTKGDTFQETYGIKLRKRKESRV